MIRLVALLTRLRRERCFCGWRGTVVHRVLVEEADA